MATAVVKTEAEISEISPPAVEVADVEEALPVANEPATVPVTVAAAEAVSSPAVVLTRQSAFRSGVASIFGLGSKPARVEEPEFPTGELPDVTPAVLSNVEPARLVDSDEVAWEMVRESQRQSPALAEGEPAEQAVREP